MDEVEALLERLTEGLGIAWYGIAYEEKQAGAQAAMLYALSILVVFPSLAAPYESWAVPFAVMLVVPLGMLGATFLAIGFVPMFYVLVERRFHGSKVGRDDVASNA